MIFSNSLQTEQVISISEFCDRALAHTEYTFLGTNYQILEFHEGWIYLVADREDGITEEAVSDLLANPHAYHESESDAMYSAEMDIDYSVSVAQ